MEATLTNELTELLNGGFAPNVILLREYDFDKAGVVLPGLPFSVWGLLEHMRQRQQVFLAFMQQPEKDTNLWPFAYWPQNMQPEPEQWERSIKSFEHDLDELIATVKKTSQHELLKERPAGKSMYWAALANLHHNGYHIGQIKAIGRQLGVW